LSNVLHTRLDGGSGVSDYRLKEVVELSFSSLELFGFNNVCKGREDVWTSCSLSLHLAVEGDVVGVFRPLNTHLCRDNPGVNHVLHNLLVEVLEIIEDLLKDGVLPAQQFTTADVVCGEESFSSLCGEPSSSLGSCVELKSLEDVRIIETHQRFKDRDQALDLTV